MMKIVLFVFLILQTPLLFSESLSPKKCVNLLKTTLKSAAVSGKDWKLSQLKELEIKCPKTEEIIYWRAATLIEQFQYQSALFQLDRLQLRVAHLNSQHWLFRWIDIRRRQIRYFRNQMNKLKYLGLKKKYSSFPKVISFLNQTASLKAPYEKMKNDLKQGQQYRGVLINDEYGDSLTRSLLRKDIDAIMTQIPILKNSLKTSQIILAKSLEQYEKWTQTGGSGGASVLGMTPSWAEREHVIVIHIDLIKNENISLLHELLHVFVRLNPDVHEETLSFRHHQGHYKKPENDSEHIFVYAGQFYLTGYAQYYKKHWASLYQILKKTFGNSQVKPRGTDIELVKFAIHRDRSNF